MTPPSMWTGACERCRKPVSAQDPVRVEHQTADEYVKVRTRCRKEEYPRVWTRVDHNPGLYPPLLQVALYPPSKTQMRKRAISCLSPDHHGGSEPTTPGVSSPVQSRRGQHRVPVWLQHHDRPGRCRAGPRQLVRTVVQPVVREPRWWSVRPELGRNRWLLLAVVRRAGPVPAGSEPTATAGGLRGVRRLLRAVLRSVGSVRAAAAALRPEIRPALVARVVVRHRGGGGSPRTQQDGRQPAHVPRGRCLPVRLGRDSVRGAEPPQHRPDGAGSRPAGRRDPGRCGVAASWRQRWDPLRGRDGGVCYQEDGDRENHAHLTQDQTHRRTVTVSKGGARGR